MNSNDPIMLSLSKEELETGYNQLKLSIASLSVKHNLSRKKIWNLLKQYEIPRRTLSEAGKGKITSDETRKARSIFQTGRKHSEETKKKISVGNKGKIVSNETKKKMSECRTSKERSEAVTGDKHPNWQGGKSSLHVQIRNLIEYKRWRKACYDRDHYTCQVCNQYSGKLNVDHVVSMSQIIKDNNITTTSEALNCKLLWDNSNGRTLCVGCHKKTDSYGGKTKKKRITK